MHYRADRRDDAVGARPGSRPVPRQADAPTGLLHLQRQAGNRAVTALVVQRLTGTPDEEIVGSAAHIEGATNIGGEAEVGGSAAVGGHAEVGGNVAVDGSTEVAGHSEVEGDSHVGGHALIGGDTHIAGALYVEGPVVAHGGGAPPERRHREEDLGLIEGARVPPL